MKSLYDKRPSGGQCKTGKAAKLRVSLQPIKVPKHPPTAPLYGVDQWHVSHMLNTYIKINLAGGLTVVVLHTFAVAVNALPPVAVAPAFRTARRAGIQGIFLCETQP